MTVVTGISSELAELAAGERRRAKRRLQRRVQTDMRTRIGRRQRAIERELRAELVKMGRQVTIHDDCLIGSLANCMVQLEIAAGDRSRGLKVDDEQITRLANTSQRLIAMLGLRHQVVEDPGPGLAELIRRERL
jgi:hypothetical protein